jgi:hypothetical protein
MHIHSRTHSHIHTRARTHSSLQLRPAVVGRNGREKSGVQWRARPFFGEPSRICRDIASSSRSGMFSRARALRVHCLRGVVMFLSRSAWRSSLVRGLFARGLLCLGCSFRCAFSLDPRQKQMDKWGAIIFCVVALCVRSFAKEQQAEKRAEDRAATSSSDPPLTDAFGGGGWRRLVQ